VTDLHTRWQRFWARLFEAVGVMLLVVVLIALLVFFIVRESHVWGCA
jgi:uncharacterized RDD family membrane protein YckC